VASPDTNTSLLATGRLAYECTDLSLAWPHGGTGLGLVGNVILFPPSGYVRHKDEATNSTDVIQYTGGDLIVSCVIEGWDDDAHRAIYPNTDPGVSREVIRWPGTDYLPGTRVGAKALEPLVFTPRNQLEHPAFIVYSAIPTLELNAELRFSSYRFLSYPVIFVGRPDGAGRQGESGPLVELTL